MPRYFVPITVEELTAKINAAYNDDTYTSIFDITPQVKKDLSKVQFDLENITMVDGFGYSLTGYHTLPNGMTFLGVAAGGDWEVPVFAILYFDGKKLRGYIPTKGNAWNRITKRAFGNANFDIIPNEDYIALEKLGLFGDLSDEEKEELKKEIDSNEWADGLINEEWLIQDIQERIQKAQPNQKKPKKVKKNIFEGVVEVCCHNVRFWYDIDNPNMVDRKEEIEELLTEEAENRAKACIIDGYSSGELNCVVDGEIEIRGWWNIEV